MSTTIITDEQITTGAKCLAKTVKRTAWDGLISVGRAADHGFNPWRYNNARQEDFRDAVRSMLSEMGITQAVPAATAEADATNATAESQISTAMYMLGDIPGDTLQDKLTCLLGRYTAMQIEAMKPRRNVG